MDGILNLAKISLDSPPPPIFPPSLSKSFLLMGGGGGANSIRLSKCLKELNRADNVRSLQPAEYTSSWDMTCGSGSYSTL